MKSILMNPYLLGMQGFVAGALMLWATPALDVAAPPASTDAAVQIVPPVS